MIRVIVKPRENTSSYVGNKQGMQVLSLGIHSIYSTSKAQWPVTGCELVHVWYVSQHLDKR